MSAEDKEDPEAPLLSTVLSQIPATDPAILRDMENTRLANRHYSAIGKIAGWWAYFEFFIDICLWDLAGINDKIGVCFTGQMIGPRPRLDAYIALVRALGCHPRWNPILEQLAKDAAGLSEQRNRAVHDVWDVSDATAPRRYEATAKRAVRLLHVQVSTNDLAKLAKNIEGLIKRFDNVATDIYSELPSRDTTPSSTAP